MSRLYKSTLRMWGIIAVSLVLLCLAVMAMLPGGTEQVPLTVSVSMDGEQVRVAGWFSDNTVYYTLPSGAAPEQAMLVPGSGGVTIGGKTIREETRLSEFETDRVYSLSDGSGGEQKNVVFVSSGGVATVWLSTKSRSENYSHQTKNAKEKVDVRLFDESGRLEYRSGRYTAALRGHGNSTWDYAKKAFNLYLPEEVDLTGNGASTDFVLLANVLDESQLRNALMLRLADETCSGWNPGWRFADLYLNGEYRGLYLLTDKVGVSEERLALGADDVLMNFESETRADGYAIPEVTPDVTAEIVYPKNLASSQVAALGEKVHAVFDGVLNRAFTEDELQQHMDLDSWARLYIIQEVSENFDSALCSLYFYLHDGKLYAGPIWDYDNTFGVRPELNGESYYAREKGVWQALFRYPVFEDTVKRIYCEDFREKLDRIFGEDSAAISDVIRKADAIDRIRWKDEHIVDSSLEQLMDFYGRRIRFLDKAWLEEIPMCTVSVEDPDEITIYYTMEAGSTLLGNEIFMEQFGKRMPLIERSDGAPFDFAEPIRQDCTLVLRLPESASEGGAGWGAQLKDLVKENVTGVMLAALCIVTALTGIVLACVDIKRSGKGDRDGSG